MLHCTIAYADKQAIEQRLELPFYVVVETQLTAQTPILARLLFVFLPSSFLSCTVEEKKNVKIGRKEIKEQMMIPDKEIISNSIVKRSCETHRGETQRKELTRRKKAKQNNSRNDDTTVLYTRRICYVFSFSPWIKNFTFQYMCICIFSIRT